MMESFIMFTMETSVALRHEGCRTTIERFSAKTIQSVRAQSCSMHSVNMSAYVWNLSELLTARVEETVSEARSFTLHSQIPLSDVSLRLIIVGVLSIADFGVDVVELGF